VGRKPARH
jgi:hypothetical protein